MAKATNGVETPRILSYPIPKEGEAKLHVYGPKDAKKLVFMCPGYPDDHSAFTPIARRLAKECDCLVGVTCLPGYAADGDLLSLPTNGYSFEEWTVCLRAATKTLRAESTRPREETSMTGVYHDWGSFAGMRFSNQAIEEESTEYQPDQIVVFDVLPAIHPKTPNKPKNVPKLPLLTQAYNGIRVLTYQGFLMWCFWIFKYLPKVFVIMFMKSVWPLLEWAKFLPAGPGDHEHLDRMIFSSGKIPLVAYKGYPYPKIIAAMLTGKLMGLLEDTWTPMDLEKTPVLFMYGGGKPYHLHTPKVEALLQQEEAAGRPSRCVGVKDSGHWLYVAKEEICFQEMVKFLDRCQK